LKLGQQLLAKQRQQDILYQDKLDEKISEELFVRTNKALEARLGYLKAELLRLQKTDRMISDSGTIMAKAEQLLQEKGLTNRLVRLLVESIIVFDPDDNLDNSTTAVLTDNERKQVEVCGGIVVNLKWAKL
jgi:hypothetical protein